MDIDPTGQKDKQYANPWKYKPNFESHRLKSTCLTVSPLLHEAIGFQIQLGEAVTCQLLIPCRQLNLRPRQIAHILIRR